MNGDRTALVRRLRCGTGMRLIQAGWLNRYGEWLALLAFLMLAAALRLYRITSLPPGLFFDEAANGVDALGVLQGQHPIFFEGNNGREPFYIYLVALSFRLFGVGPTSIRYVSIAIGLLTVLATYFMVRELFGKRVALLATFIFATGFWPLALSRLGFRAVALPLFETLAVYFLWRGSRRGQLWAYGLAGLAGGLCLYTYIASRAVPLWLGLFALALALPAWRPNITLRRHLLGIVVLALVAATTFTPLARYYVAHPAQFLGRMETVSLPTEGGTEPSAVPIDSLMINTLKTAGEFVWQGDPQPRHNLPNRPAFDPFLAAAFLLGVALSLRYLRRPPYALLLLWTAAMLGPGALATEAPHYLRTAGVLPAAFVLPALGLEAAGAWAAQRRWGVVRTLGPAILAVGVLLSAAWTARDYFVAWAGRADVYYAFNGDVVDAGRLGVSLAEKGSVLVASSFYGGMPVPLALYPGAGALARVFPGVGIVPLPNENGGDLYYLYPTSASAVSSKVCSLLPCSQPPPPLRDPEGGEAVSISRVPAGLASELRPGRPVAARIGSSIELSGYDLSRQLTSGQAALLTVYARVLQPMTEPGSWLFFAHLVERDGSDNRSSAYVPASLGGLQPGDRFAIQFALPTDKSLKPGLYLVQFGLFERSGLRHQEIMDGAGRDIGGGLILGPVRVMATAPPSVAVPNRVDAQLGDRIRLLGYQMDSPPEAGGELRLTLFWQASQPIDEDYTVFVHLADKTGKPVAQKDSQPQGGQLPTSVWASGEVVVDEYRVPLDVGLRGQKLQMLVGMYKLETNQRLPVLDAGGKATGDVVPLAEVTIR